METVTQVVGASLKDVQHWLGWIFNWDDILHTQKSLIALVEAASDADDTLLDYGFETLDHALVSAKQKFQTYTAPTQNTQVQNTPKDIKTPQADTSSKNTPTSHSGIDYILDKLKVIFQSPVVADGFSFAGVDINFWTTTVSNTLDTIKDDLAMLKNDFGDIFAAGGTMTLGHAFEKLGKDLLITLIDSLRAILTAFGGLIKPIIHSFFTAINTKVDVPILSPLYKSVANTNDNLSILSLVMLIIAVPTTILSKLVGGQDTSFPMYNAQKLRTALYHSATPAPPHNVVALFSDPSDFRASLWGFYTGPLWNEILKGYDSVQAYLIAGSFTVQNIFQTVDSAQDAKKPLRFDVLGVNIFFECVYSLFKPVTQIAYVPVIADRNNIVALEEKFLLWGFGWISTLIDIYAGCTGRTMGAVTNPARASEREKLLDLNSALQTTFGVIAFILAEKILYEELDIFEVNLTLLTQASPPDPKAIEKVNGSIFRRKWAMGEALAFLTNRAGNAWVPDVKDVKARVGLAAGISIIGELGIASCVLRFYDTPSDENFGVTT